MADILEQLHALPGALLPILHALQDALGYIPSPVIPQVAEALNISTAEVQGVLSFYHYFRSTPGATHRVQICRSEACQAMGGRALEAHATATLGVDMGETTEDRSVRLEAVYCLGNCACSPAIRIDNTVHGNIDAALFDTLVQDLRTQVVEVR